MVAIASIRNWDITGLKMAGILSSLVWDNAGLLQLPPVARGPGWTDPVRTATLKDESLKCHRPLRDLQRINSGLHLTNGFRIVRRPSMIWPPCKSSEYSVAHSDSRAAAMMSAS